MKKFNVYAPTDGNDRETLLGTVEAKTTAEALEKARRQFQNVAYVRIIS